MQKSEPSASITSALKTRRAALRDPHAGDEEKRTKEDAELRVDLEQAACGTARIRARQGREKNRRGDEAERRDHSGPERGEPRCGATQPVSAHS